MDGSVRLATCFISLGLLSEILNNPAPHYKLVNAVEKGVAYAHQKSPGDKSAAVDNALVRSGMMLAAYVEGRIVTEVDPRAAYDKEALMKRASDMVELYNESGIPKAKLLFSIPCTSAGLAAVQELEAQGIQCEVSSVYSLAQAVAAVKAKASVLRTNIARVKAWFSAHPNAVRDPTGPRQDAGVSSDVHVGLRLVADIYSYVKQAQADTKIVVMGVMSVKEAKELSGVDYLVLPNAIKVKMESEATAEGYNDGLSAAEESESGMPKLTPESARRREFRDSETSSTPADFEKNMGMAAEELLRQRIAFAHETAGRVEGFIADFACCSE